jgi:hypothetical protein
MLFAEENTARLLKDVKNEAEKKRTTDVESVRADLTEQLRRANEDRLRANSMSENDRRGPAGENGDPTAIGRCELEVESLRAAGAFCASDYNKCKRAFDSNKARIGVETE